MSWPDPAALSPLLAHFSTYGELYLTELDRAAHRWLPLLAEAGWVVRLNGDACAVTDTFLALPAALPETERLRRVCFAVPAYRRYLTAVLAEGLVKAGQVDYHEQLERWVVRELVGLAGEINALLDELEAGQGRMVEWPPERVAARFADWHAQHGSFAAWDHALLGLGGAPEQLFTAVLSHAAAFVIPSPAAAPGDVPRALLPDFDLTRDAAGHLALPTLAPWSIARRSVHSSLPFFDPQGNPLYDATQSVPVIWQDMLARQPYYRAVLRTAIAVRFSSYGPDALTLSVPDELDDTRVLVGEQERGALVDQLPHLVQVLGYRALSKPSLAQVRRILAHWIAVGALEVTGGQIHLQESYARTLHERRRALMLLRGTARKEQARLEKYLKEMG